MPTAWQIGPNRWRVQWKSKVKDGRASVNVEASTKAEALIKAGIARENRAMESEGLLLSALFERCWLEKWRHNKDSQVKQRANEWITLIGDLRVNEITPQIIQKGVLLLDNRGIKGATVNRYLSALRFALNRAEEWGMIDRCPKVRLRPERPMKMRFLTPEEEDKLVEVCNEQGDHDLGNLVRLLADTGARIGEALALTWSDISIKPDGTGSIVIWLNKSDRPRTVPLTSRCVKILRQKKWEDSEEVFKFGYHYYQKRFTMAVETIGWSDVTIHTLRHTCGSRLIQRGVPIYAVSKWMGHGSVKTTERYLHLGDTLQGYVEVLE